MEQFDGWHLAGEVTIGRRAPTFTIAGLNRPNLLSGSHWKDLTGPVAFELVPERRRVTEIPADSARELCGKRLDWVDSWFQRRGDITVFVGRLLPLVRAFISLPASVAEMPLRRFIPLTLAGSLIWLSGLTLIGRAVGDNWEDLHRKLAFLDYVVVAAAIAGIAYLIIKRRGGGAKPQSGPEGEPAAEG
jgi:hypothetical protein